MGFVLESLPFSPAASLRSIELQAAAPSNAGIRNLSQLYDFKDQSHAVFYQSLHCRLAEKSNKKRMQRLAATVTDNQNLEPLSVATLTIGQGLLQEVASLKLQLKEKKRQVKEQKRALKAQKNCKESKANKTLLSSSSSSESSNSDADDCNTVDMRTMREGQSEQKEVGCAMSTDAKCGH